MNEIIKDVIDSISQDITLNEKDLDNTINNNQLPYKEKIERVKFLLRDISILRTSITVWQSYFQQPEPQKTEENQPIETNEKDKKE